MKPEKDNHIKKNRIFNIEADTPGRPDRSGLKKTVFILASIAAVSIAIILLITNYLYDEPDSFISRLYPGDREVIDASAPDPENKIDNFHLKQGRESYRRNYISDAISSFNEVVESDASNREKAIALTYLGMINNDRAEYQRALDYYERALNYDDKDPLIYRNKAQTYRKMGRHDEAVRYALKALELKKNDPDTLLLLGNIYFETSQYKKASEQYARALDHSPENPALLYNKGLSLLRTGSRFEAAEYLKLAAAEDKTGEISHKAYSRLGVLFTELQQYDSAQKYLEAAVSIRPSDASNRYNLGIVYLRQNENEKALAEFIEAEKHSTRDSIMLENLGDAYRSAGDYNRSLSAYEEVIKQDRRNVRILSRIGQIYYDQGKLDQALSSFRKITEIEPATENARMAYLNIGNILDDYGRFEEAIEAYEKAIALDPRDSDAYYNLGLSYKNAGMPERAIRSWRKGAEVNRDDPSSAIAIADYYHENEMLDLAEREYESIINRWPDIQGPHFKLASVSYKRGRLNAALAGFQRVIELDPDTDFARRSLINSAVITMRQSPDEKNLEQAVNSIQRALMLKPNDPEALFSLGLVYYRAEMSERAIESFLQAIRSTADTNLIAEAYNNIGKSYFQKQEFRKALQNFQRAVEENPSKEEYRINRKTASEAYEARISER